MRILLYERDIEAAWREAHSGGCRNNVWLELARAREKTNPEDAFPVYQRLVANTLKVTDKRAYREAVDLISHVRAVMTRAGKPGEFEAYLAEVRREHRFKRNFITLLDRKRLGMGAGKDPGK